MPDPAGTTRLGVEHSDTNAWGSLLAQAPRLARGIHDTPGAAGMLAKVLNGLELLARQSGKDPTAYAGRLRCEVDCSPAAGRIVVRVR